MNKNILAMLPVFCGSAAIILLAEFILTKSWGLLDALGPSVITSPAS